MSSIFIIFNYSSPYKVLEPRRGFYLLKWYTGTFDGYYYQCIENLHKEEKYGGQQINQNELFIPPGILDTPQLLTRLVVQLQDI